MRRCFRGFAALALALASAAALTACGSSGESSGGASTASGDKPVLRLGISSYTGYGPYFIGKEKGFFEEAGVDLRPTVVGDDALQRGVAVRAGKLEGFATTLDTVINTIAKGVPVVNVMVTDASDGADGVVGGDGMSTVADLRGREVAVQEGTTTQFLLAYALQRNGMSLDDITARNLDPSAAGSAFVAGRVPAAATWQPWLDQAAESGGTVLASTKDYPDVIVDTIALGREWAEDNPDAVRAAIAGWDRSIEFLRSNPKEAIEIMSRGLDTRASDIEDQLESIKFYTSAEARRLMGTADAPGPLYAVADEAGRFWSEIGDVSTAVKATDALDPQYLGNG
ncbi:ABC transporter substrate-binding protein [Conexibacter arvalis]|uniref:NitT/TauT family transport system substrate-binding protein n=1 Tax=Conexibacter arvalis TaxID=912552 RepID=A0A840IDR9_9ACTN|nr:ABC transporter substrate-binding protein [Conexibacter arvalis]MBB4662178.1 NitT/TauT family transport system substrate-binding protein [Conexibacter arvalis]